MTKNLKNLTKMLMIPTLVIGGLSACGYNNDGAGTNNFDRVRPYSNGGVGTYNNYNFEGTRAYDNDGRRLTHFGTNSYNYDGARPYNNYGGTNSFNYDGNRQYPNGSYQYNYGTGTYNNNSGYRNDRNTNDSQQSKRVARHAANVAKDVNGVTRATAVAHGRDIVVGIDVKEGSNFQNIEQKVRQKVQANEPGYKIHVTSDNNIHKRIQTIYTNMNNNNNNNGNNTFNNNIEQPVREFGRDVGDVVQDIGRTMTAPFR